MCKHKDPHLREERERERVSFDVNKLVWKTIALLCFDVLIIRRSSIILSSVSSRCISYSSIYVTLLNWYSSFLSIWYKYAFEAPWVVTIEIASQQYWLDNIWWTRRGGRGTLGVGDKTHVRVCIFCVIETEKMRQLSLFFPSCVVWNNHPTHTSILLLWWCRVTQDDA